MSNLQKSYIPYALLVVICIIVGCVMALKNYTVSYEKNTKIDVIPRQKNLVPEPELSPIEPDTLPTLGNTPTHTNVDVDVVRAPTSPQKQPPKQVRQVLLPPKPKQVEYINSNALSPHKEEVNTIPASYQKKSTHDSAISVFRQYYIDLKARRFKESFTQYGGSKHKSFENYRSRKGGMKKLLGNSVTDLEVEIECKWETGAIVRVDYERHSGRHSKEYTDYYEIKLVEGTWKILDPVPKRKVNSIRSTLCK